jgi:hypothetical protein
MCTLHQVAIAMAPPDGRRNAVPAVSPQLCACQPRSHSDASANIPNHAIHIHGSTIMRNRFCWHCLITLLDCGHPIRMLTLCMFTHMLNGSWYHGKYTMRSTTLITYGYSNNAKRDFHGNIYGSVMEPRIHYETSHYVNYQNDNARDEVSYNES